MTKKTKNDIENPLCPNCGYILTPVLFGADGEVPIYCDKCKRPVCWNCKNCGC